MAERVLDYIDNEWTDAGSTESRPVVNPATGRAIADVVYTTPAGVARAVEAGERAFAEWREVPVVERTQYLFRLKMLLEEHIDEIAGIVTNECGKTKSESAGELRRGIENVEVACGMPTLMQGYCNEDIAQGIDEQMIRQPLGVVAAITPFNFPAMIPLWFLPYAVATGNCFILKPSEKVPMTCAKLFELIAQAGFPRGVVQLVNGGRETAEALLDHPRVRAVSFVGSTPVARYVYQRATASGKRAQCQGGAKNPVVILPDADLEATTRIMADSAFGCAGQRCLAASVAVTVGEAHGPFAEAMREVATARRVGYGLDEGVEMGPVITPESRSRIDGLITEAEREGARVLVDGRGRSVPGYEDGNWVFPTVLDGVAPASTIATTEVFGPVLSLMPADSLDDAIRLVNERAYGNMACIFTASGAAARRFRHEADAGNIGINLGVAAPMAFFPFSGWNESFFGDLHAQGRHGVEFYTQTKVVIERWPHTWSRRF